MVGTGLKVPAPCESRMHHNQREPIQVLALLPLSTSPRPKKKAYAAGSLKSLKCPQLRCKPPTKQSLLKFSGWLLAGFPC